MRAPIMRSVSPSSRCATNSSASRTDFSVNWSMLSPLTVTASDSGFRRAPLQTGHGAERHVLLDPLLLQRRLGLAIPALEARDDALERRQVAARAAAPVAWPVGDVDLLIARAPQEQVALVAREIAPRDVDVDLVAVDDPVHELVEEARACEVPGCQGSLGDRQRRVGHDELGIDLELRAESGAARARTVRRVEAEHARRHLGQRHAMLGTRELLGVQPSLAVDDRDLDEPVGELDRRLDRVGQSLAQIVLHHEPIDHDCDVVLELLVERRNVLDQVGLVVDPDAREALAPQLVEHVAMLALAAAHDRSVDRESRARRAARAPDRRSARPTVPRSPGRRSGSAGARSGHTGAGDSRRSR